MLEGEFSAWVCVCVGVCLCERVCVSHRCPQFWVWSVSPCAQWWEVGGESGQGWVELFSFRLAWLAAFGEFLGSEVSRNLEERNESLLLPHWPWPRESSLSPGPGFTRSHKEALNKLLSFSARLAETEPGGCLEAVSRVAQMGPSPHWG